MNHVTPGGQVPSPVWGRARGMALVVLFAAAAAAHAQDLVAPARQWCNEFGPAAGTRASRALPVVGDVEEAWSVKLPGPAAGAPVHWNGIAYLLCADGGRRSLLAVDLDTGDVRAQKPLAAGPLSPPVVWDGLVLIKLEEDQFVGYTLHGTSLSQRWKPRSMGGPLSDPVVADGELYFTAGGVALLRLRFGDREEENFGAALEFDDRFLGRPAVYGDLVFALFHGFVPGYEPSLHLAVFNRKTGEVIAFTNVAWYASGDLPGGVTTATITVTDCGIWVQGGAPFKTTRGTATHALMPCRFDRSRLTFAGPAELYQLDQPPSGHAPGTLSLNTGGATAWNLWRRNEQGQTRGIVLATAADRPDLFTHTVPATVLGDIVYFGSWAADIETGEVLWYLPVAEPSFAAVPADGLVLVVDGTTLRAFREAGDS